MVATLDVKNKKSHVGFLGFGNMAQGIVDGLLLSGYPKDQLWAVGRNEVKLKKNTEARGIRGTTDHQALVEQCDVIVVAVKPHQVRDLLMPLKDLLKGKILVSLAVGLSLSDYDFLEGLEILPTLPNTPMAVGEGTLVVSEEHSLSKESLERVVALFERIGQVVFVSKEEMGIAGSITGCGPAFAAMFLEALGDGGVRYGLKRETAYHLAASMLKGTAALYLEKKNHPGGMKDAVTSPGGTTIEGVVALEREGFRNAVLAAIEAIKEKDA